MTAIYEEKEKYDEKKDFVISTGVEADMRYINDKLIIKPSLEFSLSHSFNVYILIEGDGKAKSETTTISSSNSSDSSSSSVEPKRELPKEILSFNITLRKFVAKIGLNLEYRW